MYRCFKPEERRGKGMADGVRMVMTDEDLRAAPPRPRELLVAAPEAGAVPALLGRLGGVLRVRRHGHGDGRGPVVFHVLFDSAAAAERATAADSPLREDPTLAACRLVPRRLGR
jgi:hypothetical protein